MRNFPRHVHITPHLACNTIMTTQIVGILNPRGPNFQPQTGKASTTPTVKLEHRLRLPSAKAAGPDSDTDQLSGTYDSYFYHLGQIEQTYEGKYRFILDSAARPTHCPRPHPLLKPLPLQHTQKQKPISDCHSLRKDPFASTLTFALSTFPLWLPLVLQTHSFQSYQSPDTVN